MDESWMCTHINLPPFSLTHTHTQPTLPPPLPPSQLVNVTACVPWRMLCWTYRCVFVCCCNLCLYLSLSSSILSLSEISQYIASSERTNLYPYLLTVAALDPRFKALPLAGSHSIHWRITSPLEGNLFGHSLCFLTALHPIFSTGKGTLWDRGGIEGTS